MLNPTHQQSSAEGRGSIPRIAQQNGGVVLAEELRVQVDAFQLTADPKFCYLDPVRRHASARFLSGLYEGDGLCTLTGQLGIGKTTLLRHLAEQLTALDGVLLLCPTHVLACRTETTLADVLGACEAKLGLGESGAASAEGREAAAAAGRKQSLPGPPPRRRRSTRRRRAGSPRNPDRVAGGGASSSVDRPGRASEHP